MQKVQLAKSLAAFSDFWSPRVVGALNGQHVKLVKLQGDFVWHQHALEDELFLVVKGTFRLDYREANGAESGLQVNEGEFVIVPRGVEHKPFASDECHVLLFEPAGTRNTGHVTNELTVENPAQGY